MSIHRYEITNGAGRSIRYSEWEFVFLSSPICFTVVCDSFFTFRNVHDHLWCLGDCSRHELTAGLTLELRSSM